MQILYYILLTSFSLIATGGLFSIYWGIKKAIKIRKAKNKNYDTSIGAIIGGFLIFYAFSLSAFFMTQ